MVNPSRNQQSALKNLGRKILSICMGIVGQALGLSPAGSKFN